MKWFALIIPSLSLFSSIAAYGNYGPVSTIAPPYEHGGCSMGIDKVCGTNGFENFLFDNLCEMNDFNGKQLRAGHLILQKIDLELCYPSTQNNNPKSYCPQYCNFINQPVCGTYLNVQRNFTNECEMRRYMCQYNENWQLVSNTTCVPPPCGPQAQQICAIFSGQRQEFSSVDALYDDIRATGRNWQILNVGQCPCPMDYKPLCAKVNCTTQTYLNECFFQRAIQNATYWTILFHGECPLIPTPCNGTASDLVIVSSTPSSPNETTTVATTIAPVDPETTTLPGAADAVTIVPGAVGSQLLQTACNTTAAMIRNRPVYIVKKDRIIPYGQPMYTIYGVGSASNGGTKYNSYGSEAKSYSSSYNQEPYEKPYQLPYPSNSYDYSTPAPRPYSSDSNYGNQELYRPEIKPYSSSYGESYKLSTAAPYPPSYGNSYKQPYEKKFYDYEPTPKPYTQSYNSTYQNSAYNSNYRNQESYGSSHKQYSSSYSESYTKPTTTPYPPSYQKPYRKSYEKKLYSYETLTTTSAPSYQKSGEKTQYKYEESYKSVDHQYSSDYKKSSSYQKPVEKKLYTYEESSNSEDNQYASVYGKSYSKPTKASYTKDYSISYSSSQVTPSPRYYKTYKNSIPKKSEKPVYYQEDEDNHESYSDELDNIFGSKIIDNSKSNSKTKQHKIVSSVSKSKQTSKFKVMDAVDIDDYEESQYSYFT
ncbi:uncharacterized protein LOC142237507 [Haematobia irritans]|uniref:uncharacterized protein LOC142237507 n=1 Tax=Haematobia irritans TaxID=7368 RepID=UPI003F4F425F